MKKLSLKQRAAHASARRRLFGDHYWSVYRGYLTGHRAAKRDAGRVIEELKRHIDNLKASNAALRDINTREANRANRFERALRERARRDMMETRTTTAPDGRERHPYKELRP